MKDLSLSALILFVFSCLEILLLSSNEVLATPLLKQLTGLGFLPTEVVLNTFFLCFILLYSLSSSYQKNNNKYSFALTSIFCISVVSALIDATLTPDVDFSAIRVFIRAFSVLYLSLVVNPILIQYRPSYKILYFFIFSCFSLFCAFKLLILLTISPILFFQEWKLFYILAFMGLICIYRVSLGPRNKPLIYASTLCFFLFITVFIYTSGLLIKPIVILYTIGLILFVIARVGILASGVLFSTVSVAIIPLLISSEVFLFRYRLVGRDGANVDISSGRFEIWSDYLRSSSWVPTFSKSSDLFFDPHNLYISFIYSMGFFLGVIAIYLFMLVLYRLLRSSTHFPIQFALFGSFFVLEFFSPLLTSSPGISFVLLSIATLYPDK